MVGTASPDTTASDAERIATLTARLQETETVLTNVRRAYTRALEELALLHRRLFVGKAERSASHPDQLAFDELFAQVERLGKQLDAASPADSDTASGSQGDGKGRKGKAKDGARPAPSGRRDLSTSNLPVVRVEVTDPALEGKAERIGFEESSRLGFERGGMRHVVVARAVYKLPSATEASPSTASTDAITAPITPRADDAPAAAIAVTPVPKELFRRALLAPSMIAHVLVSKYLLGVPFYRLEQSFALQGAHLDRGTMCRYAEDAGGTLGAIVEAARADAFAHAFCLSTDATGVSIQPGPLQGRDRGPCRKGHFFVVLADRDHVFFEYQPKHTSAAVCDMFKGFKGYIQADAHTIYDALFRDPGPIDVGTGPPPTEVGCWSHCRRHFWEAAVCKHTVGIEGLRRIDALFAADNLFKDMPPAERKVRRDQHLRPMLDAFFAWVETENARPLGRGLVRSALGYALNQREPLLRFLEDGRLRMDNNGSERALRAIASARKAWLFFGSDDHANAAANLFSLVASCKLHGLDPERYLADVIRVMPYWPRERYLELAPMRWTATRSRLRADELDAPLGHITLPPPEPPQEQASSD